MDGTEAGSGGTARAAPTGPTESDEPDGSSDDRERLPIGVTLVAAAIAAAVVAPLLWLVSTALGLGLETLVAQLTAPQSLEIAANSAVMVTLVTAGSVLIGVPMAYLTARTDVPFRRALTVGIALPLVIPSYIGAFAAVSMFGPRGEIQSLLEPWGVESLPEIYGLAGTVVVLTLYTYPYVFLTTRAALLTLDDRLVDAARTLNHSRLAAIRRVVLPQIQPAIAAGALLVALYALSDFGTPAIMRFDVYTRVIYTRRFDLEFASMLSLQLLTVTLLILALESRLRGDEVASGGRTRSKRVPLGRLRWPAVGLCASVIAVAVGLPILILVLWLLRSTATGDAGGSLLEVVWNSVLVSTAAAAVAAVACLPIAYLAAYHRGRIVDALERATYLGYAAPGVVLGLALVFVGSRFLTPIYQQLPLLIFAYVVRFLPQAVGTSRAGFLGIDPQLPAAARTFGRSPVGAFRSVTLPLIAPGLLAGAALVFLTTMKELPVTLLLRPSGFETLVTRIWQAEEAGYFGEAAIPALVLVFVSGLSILFILSQEGYDGGS
ncbi:ABC transporter permease subunit [Halomontanus rarus]|uniref:ABC transporter permease subunit n=1 Tax=Halomontanus rarus TaxID=3034020 RepID=UPI001A99F4CC